MNSIDDNLLSLKVIHYILICFLDVALQEIVIHTETTNPGYTFLYLKLFLKLFVSEQCRNVYLYTHTLNK